MASDLCGGLQFGTYMKFHPDVTSYRAIARGAGVDISEVNRMVKQFAEMKKMMKMLGKGGKRRKFGMPF